MKMIHLKGNSKRRPAMGMAFWFMGIFMVSSVLCTEPRDDEIVTTKHQVTVDGRTIAYTARAGKIPIRDNEAGEIHAQMFFIAYTLDRSPDQGPRPLTFLWNGGPGSSSSLVHLLGFGPKHVRTGAEAVDNQGTWLDFSDLVFIDPIGTGYSRPIKAEYGPEFYQTQGDAESVAEFIRVYRNRYEAWDAPLFVGGESFGVQRAAGVAEVLQRRGITVDGVILISAGLPLGKLSKELRTALMVPTYAAAGFANNKLSPELQTDLQATLREVEEWAGKEYAPALSASDSLSDPERQGIVSQLAKFTGLDPDLVDSKTLRIETNRFSRELLRDQNLVIGLYDSRFTGTLDLEEKQYDPTKDPSLRNIIDDVSILRYFRHELKYESDLLYQGPFGGGYPPPDKPRGDWMSTKWNWSPEERSRFSGEEAQKDKKVIEGRDTEKEKAAELPLRNAMTANPALKVFMASGYFDLVCSYAANAYLAAHLEPGLKRNVTARAYSGGHAIYTDETAQLAMKRDVAKFIEQVLANTN